VLLLLLFIFLKKDYFWFAYFFIVIQGPGYFFADFSGASLHRLPLYTILPGFSFTPVDFFVILAFIKAIIMGKKMRLYLEKQLILLLIGMILIIIITSFLFGASIGNLAWNLRWLFYYSIIISFLYLVNKKHEIYYFIILISPVVFFILFTQLYYVTTGNEFIDLFNPGFRGISVNSITGEIRPSMGGILTVFFSFIFSIFLLVNENFKLPKIYLYLVIAVAFLSVFLSATRLWFIIFSFIFAGYILVTKKKILSVMGIVSIFFVVIGLLNYFGFIRLGIQSESSWARIQQVFDVAKGNLYSIDTAKNRLVNQSPIIMGIIKHNPLIGYGFSDITMLYYDDDFGFLNTILMFGIVGFALFALFFIGIFRILGSTIKRISFSNPFRTSLKIMIIAWAGILIGYLSTWDFFTMDFGKVFFVSLLIAVVEFFILQAKKEEILIWS
jgi:hypothetical protein